MFFKHIYDDTLAQGSYLIGCQETGEAMVIDAKRDIDTYLEVAGQNGLRITHIAETHIHADYLCGSRELAKVTGAKMYLSDEGGEGWQYEFPHEGIKGGDVIRMGNLTFEVIHTPGHTPESVSFLLTDHAASDKPTMLFTGDFVFVGDVGRPDLLEEAAGIKGTKTEGAKDLYASLKHFVKLPDYVQVWPAHGAGSACGKALGAVPNSTVGYEKYSNWALQFGEDEKGFVDALLSGQPEPPKYFALMKKYNKVDRPLLTEVPKHKKLTKDEFSDAYEKGVKVIDTRDRSEFTKGFIPGSINIKNFASFSTWMGWIVDFYEPFILVAKEEEMEDLTRKLMRIGMDNMWGYITDVEEAGIPLEKAELIDIDTFKSYLNQEDVQVLDVRGKSEYQISHIPGTKNVFVGTLQDHLDEVDRDKRIVVHCKSGTRAAIAQSVLLANGFEGVISYPGGMDEWMEKEGKTA